MPLSLAEKLELVSAFLETGSTLSLSTTSDDGSPRVAPLFYLPGDNLELHWLSSRRSAHSRNLDRDSSAAITVYSHAEKWQDVRGVQMLGAATPVTGRVARRPIVDAYLKRFRLGTLFRPAIARSRVYVFRPLWVRYIDNARGFGFKFELDL